ncbi:MAG: gliding motility protein GldL [Salinivirgaceae bacterium]|nr:gliding motility protein GldL [Salinivirgaceae bacterium]MDY0279849.1 gliding motility protein GldL [Salinivirgaceae bacterium]
MSLSEFVESKAYKNIMKFVYGWGAAVVLMGALFKIMHWPGAGPMLIAGMGTEVLIFFLSAFEPLHEEVDWTLVYPELAGMTDDFEMRHQGDRHGMGFHDNRLMNISNMPPPAQVFDYDQPDGGVVQQPNAPAMGGFSGGGFTGAGMQSFQAIEKFDALLSEANLSSEMFQKLGEGIHKVGDIADKFQNLEATIESTGEFSQNISGAAKAAEGLSNACNNSSDILKESVGSLSTSYLQSADLISSTGQTIANTVDGGVKTMVGALGDAGARLIESISNSDNEMRQAYQLMLDHLNQTADSVKKSSQGYTQNIEAQNKNLSAINSVYELHIQNITQHTQMIEDLNGKSKNMVEGFNEGLQQTVAYKDELKKLNNQLSQLNEVYGSMLSTVTLNEY